MRGRALIVILLSGYPESWRLDFRIAFIKQNVYAANSRTVLVWLPVLSMVRALSRRGGVA
jgi:hypothetical protein